MTQLHQAHAVNTEASSRPAKRECMLFVIVRLLSVPLRVKASWPAVLTMCQPTRPHHGPWGQMAAAFLATQFPSTLGTEMVI